MADRQFCYKDKNNVLAGLQCRDRDRGVGRQREVMAGAGRKRKK